MIFKVNVWRFKTITTFQFLDFFIIPERSLVPIYSQPPLLPLFLITFLEVPYNLTTLFQGPDVSHMVILVSKKSGKCRFKKIWAHCHLKEKLAPLLKKKKKNLGRV